MPVQSDLEIVQELRLVPAFGELAKDLLHEIAAACSQRRVHAGTTLVEQGASAQVIGLDILARGAVKITRRSRHTGGESIVILDVLRAPAILADSAIFDGRPSTASIVTLRSSQIIALDRKDVLKIAARHSAFARALLAHLAECVRRHVRRIDEVASGPVDDRVKHLLEQLAADHGTPFGGGRFIAIPLRRKDIACMVNATTETVSRLLARFEREGLVRTTRDGLWWNTAPAAPDAVVTTRGAR
jgi:CRP/FNR family transcriptional regulator, cyclic AMP receptor protein